LNEGVARSQPGAGGLLFCFLDEGYGVTSGLVGLTLTHSRDDLTRAVMEGITFELRLTLDRMREAGVKVAELIMVGGATESPVWPQIVADITGVPVSLPTVKQAASRGAAILAGGVAIMSSYEARLAPNPVYISRYDELYQRYERTVKALQSLSS
jgi:xylulokinase